MKIWTSAELVKMKRQDREGFVTMVRTGAMTPGDLAFALSLLPTLKGDFTEIYVSYLSHRNHMVAITAAECLGDLTREPAIQQEMTEILENTLDVDPKIVYLFKKLLITTPPPKRRGGSKKK
jgi:hypothetical protein